jgi:hypothetical protein
MSTFSDIESLIERCAPVFMKRGSGTGSGDVRAERRTKSAPGSRTGFKIISPEAAKYIMSQAALGKGPTEIAEHLRINAENVRTHLRKHGIKASPAKTKALRSSPYSGVTMTRTK